MIIMGIDPGLHHTGIGVIRQEGSALHFIAAHTITTAASAPLLTRLALLARTLTEHLTTYRPDHIAMEESFVNVNARSSLVLGQARGALMVTVASYMGADTRYHEYSPTQIKKALVGVGRAEKHQVAAMVKHLLPRASPDSADAADALAVALCHSSHVALLRALR